MLYFAYGSNLHHQQMKKRCKDSRFIKKIILKNYMLTFRGKYGAADIEKKGVIKYMELYIIFHKLILSDWIFMRNTQKNIRRCFLNLINKKL